MNSDLEHLRTLSICQYIAAAMAGLCSFFPCIYVFLGTALVVGAFPDNRGQQPPPVVGAIVMAIGLVGICAGVAMAVCMAMTARRLQTHTGYTFCLVIAAIECLNMPLGTILGVFTIVVLMRPSVRQLFGVEPTLRPPYPAPQ